MVILHIAVLTESLYNGVNVVVPKHVIAQQKLETVALLNVLNVKYEGIENMLNYRTPFAIAELPQPFNKPDIVILHQLYNKEYIGIVENLRKEKIPYILVPHGALTHEAQSKNKYKKWLGNQLFFNRIIKNAVAVQCLSEREKDFSIKGNKFIGTNGISMPVKYKNCFRREALHITYIGRLEAEIKGLDLMTEAFKLAGNKLRSINAVVNLYGPDWNGRYAALEEMIKENEIGDFVTLHPAVSDKEKEEVLLDTDIFIQTSRSEGMPMGILEALSYGIPCLVTQGTALGELINQHDAGWECATDVQGISETLKKALLEIDKLEEKGRNARKMICKRYDWEIVARDTICSYKEILSDKR